MTDKQIINELRQQLIRKEQECDELKEKLLRKRAVVEFADCPHYSYGDNTIEPTCTKNFCYDVKFCDHKNIVKYKQALAKIKEICSEMNCESLMQNSWCGNTDFKMGCCEKLFKKQILQEISESEVDNAR